MYFRYCRVARDCGGSQKKTFTFVSTANRACSAISLPWSHARLCLSSWGSLCTSCVSASRTFSALRPRGRGNSMTNRLRRSTRVSMADFPMMRSPSQCPGTQPSDRGRLAVKRGWAHAGGMKAREEKRRYSPIRRGSDGYAATVWPMPSPRGRPRTTNSRRGLVSTGSRRCPAAGRCFLHIRPGRAIGRSPGCARRQRVLGVRCRLAADRVRLARHMRHVDDLPRRLPCRSIQRRGVRRRFRAVPARQPLCRATPGDPMRCQPQAAVGHPCMVDLPDRPEQLAQPHRVRRLRGRISL